MPEGSFHYCDVSLPVPLDRPFTYSLPETLRHRVKPGCRVIVPFGPRKMTGVTLRCHDDAPDVATRDALRLIDSEPVLDGELLALARWIANYYCAPLGEVLRTMLPLASEIRSGKVYSLTDAGLDAARQLLLDAGPEDPVASVLRMLEKYPLSASYLAKSGYFSSEKASSSLSMCARSATRCARPPRICGSSSKASPLRAGSPRLSASWWHF